MSSWGIRWNPWSLNYSSLEGDQMRFIHKAYCEAMQISDTDLPAQLKMNDTFSAPLYQPTISDFDEHSFMRKMQDVVGLLRNPAESIISTICAYQKARMQRFSGNYQNDPRTLLLEEFKDWTMRVLAPASCTQEATLNEVRKRHGYILRLHHGQQGLFHSGSGERSLLSTLKEIRQIIEYRILATIESERAHSSAREQLHTLEARGIDGLMHGIQFLFYVLRSTPNVPSDCTISTLQSRNRVGIKEALDSKSGKMMQLLLETNSFRTLFPIHASDDEGDSSMVKAQTTFPGPLFADNKMRGIIPTQLSKEEVSPYGYLRNGAGLVPLREDVAVDAYDKFTRLHAMLKLLADLLVSCRKARQLAGPGGDLLVYGPGGTEVRHLVQSCESVQQEIVKLVSRITRIGVRQLDRLKPHQEKHWRASFSKVLPLENYISHDFQACIEPIQRIYASADPVHVKKLYRQFREATGQWVKDNASICEDVNLTLGLRTIDRNQRHELLLDDKTDSNSEIVYQQELSPISNLKVHQETTDTIPIPGSISTVATGIVGLNAATSLVSWAANKGVGMLGLRTGCESVSGSLEENASVTLDGNRLSNSLDESNIGKFDGTSISKNGTMDALLMMRQAVQRLSQIAWSVKGSLRTCYLDDTECDTFAFLCAIYDAAGVETCEVLFSSIKHHVVAMQHLFRTYLPVILRCIELLRKRIIDADQEGLTGVMLAFKGIEKVLLEFIHKQSELRNVYSRTVHSCEVMAQGIHNVPDLNQTQHHTGTKATYSLSSLAGAFGSSLASTSVNLSHGEYMTQVNSSLNLHSDSLRHMEQSLQASYQAISLVINRLQELASFPVHYDSKFHQQIDYIFEFNYHEFFCHATQDLQHLVEYLNR